MQKFGSIDLPPAVVQYPRRVIEKLVTVSFKLPVSDLRRIPTRNRSRFYREAIRNELERKAGGPQWTPKTAAAKRMAALRARYVAGGGELLDAEGIAAEVRKRRGGLA